MRSHAAARPMAGFTLIEVVLALVIFSLITLMVYGAFYVGHRAVARGEHSADMSQRIRLADDIVTRQVRSAVIAYGLHDEEQVAYFVGRADGVSFVSAAPQGHGGTGLAVVTYRATRDGLVLEERTGFHPDDLYSPPADARVQRVLLLDGFSAIRFEYLPHEEGDSWQSAWDGREEESLPAAIRITIDGLEFFGAQPWVQEIPLMTIAYGWGTEDFQDPPDEFGEENDESDEDAADEADADDDGDDE